MDINAFIEAIGQCELKGDKIVIGSEKIHDALLFIKNNFTYKMLKSITAIDLGKEIELIYNLYSIENEETVLISITVQQDAISVTDIFSSAIADENEIYDLFGINFSGNKDLKRLYMPKNWDGYPLKKDYIQDDTRLVWNDDNNNDYT